MGQCVNIFIGWIFTWQLITNAKGTTKNTTSSFHSFGDRKSNFESERPEKYINHTRNITESESILPSISYFARPPEKKNISTIVIHSSQNVLPKSISRETEVPRIIHGLSTRIYFDKQRNIKAHSSTSDDIGSRKVRPYGGSRLIIHENDEPLIPVRVQTNEPKMIVQESNYVTNVFGAKKDSNTEDVFSNNHIKETIISKNFTFQPHNDSVELENKTVQYLTSSGRDVEATSQTNVNEKMDNIITSDDTNQTLETQKSDTKDEVFEESLNLNEEVKIDDVMGRQENRTEVFSEDDRNLKASLIHHDDSFKKKLMESLSTTTTASPSSFTTPNVSRSLSRTTPKFQFIRLPSLLRLKNRYSNSKLGNESHTNFNHTTQTKIREQSSFNKSFSIHPKLRHNQTKISGISNDDIIASGLTERKDTILQTPSVVNIKTNNNSIYAEVKLTNPESSSNRSQNSVVSKQRFPFQNRNVQSSSISRGQTIPLENPQNQVVPQIRILANRFPFLKKSSKNSETTEHLDNGINLTTIAPPILRQSNVNGTVNKLNSIVESVQKLSVSYSTILRQRSHNLPRDSKSSDPKETTTEAFLNEIVPSSEQSPTENEVGDHGVTSVPYLPIIVASEAVITTTLRNIPAEMSTPQSDHAPVDNSQEEETTVTETSPNNISVYLSQENGENGDLEIISEITSTTDSTTESMDLDAIVSTTPVNSQETAHYSSSFPTTILASHVENVHITSEEMTRELESALASTTSIPNALIEVTPSTNVYFVPESSTETDEDNYIENYLPDDHLEGISYIGQISLQEDLSHRILSIFKPIDENLLQPKNSTHQTKVSKTDILPGNVEIQPANTSDPLSSTTVYIVALVGVIPAAGLLAWLGRHMLKQRKRSSEESHLPENETRLAHDGNENIINAEVPKGDQKGNRTIQEHEVSKNHSPLSIQTDALIVKSGPWEVPRHKLRLNNILGEGHFGQVWKAEAENICGFQGTVLVAVKTVKDNANAKEKQDILREMELMQKLGPHPNLVTLLGCCTKQEPYYLVMEYVMYGKLLTFLRDCRSKQNYYNFSTDSYVLTAKDVTLFGYHVAKGMEYLVFKGVIHRDLAARNILIDHNKVCKIADFGLSRHIKSMEGEIYAQRSKGALPIRWMAPESLYFSIFTHKSDVWSFGILMWEIVTLGSTPYAGMTAREVMRNVKDGHYLQRPGHCRPELYKIMSKCWDLDSTRRPEFSELRVDLGRMLDHAAGYIDLENFCEDDYTSINNASGEKV